MKTVVPTFRFYFVKPFNMAQRGLASSPITQVLGWGTQFLKEDIGTGDTGTRAGDRHSQGNTRICIAMCLPDELTSQSWLPNWLPGLHLIATKE